MFKEHVIPNCNLKHQQEKRENTKFTKKNDFLEHSQERKKKLNKIFKNGKKVVVDHNTHRGSH